MVNPSAINFMSLPDVTSSDTARPSWVTADLLDRTQRLWSRRYGRSIDTAEAIGILVRVGKLMDLLHPKHAARPRAVGS